MRGLYTSLGLAFGVSAAAQWVPVPVFLPPWFTFGNYNNGPVVFTSPGIGFTAQSTYVSPSIGYIYRILGTADEWGTHPTLSDGGGGPGSQGITGMWRSNDHGCFFRRLSGGSFELRSFTWVDGIYEQKGYPSFGYPGDTLRVSPVNGTRAYIHLHKMDGSFRMRWVWPVGYREVYGLPDTVNRVVAVEFHDEQTGAVVLVSEEGVGEVWVTTDAGEQWSRSHSDEQPWYRAMVWLSDQVAWIAGDGGRIIITQDAGQTWIEQASPASNDWLCVSGYSPEHLWIGGRQGMVFATRDGGESWSDLSLDAEEVIELMTYHKLAYARARVWHSSGQLTTRFFKRVVSSGGDSAGSEPWWSIAPNGIFLELVEEDEVVQDLSMYDAAGRQVRVVRYGRSVPLEHLPAGVYIAHLRSNLRNSAAKIPWQGRNW
ncbi:MAG: hypothetical protein KIT10_10975 [Flavobacteriales bacterium]|nr:hypothetical protein [Flavobacteriales bacterium]